MMAEHRMSRVKKLVIGIVVIAVLMVGIVVYNLNSIDRDYSDEIVDFDSCVAAGYPVFESYPRQCRTGDGRNFVEPVPEYGNWENDGIDLARIRETGEYQCFGCSNFLCVDPLLDAIEFVDETPDRYCNSDFEVVD